MSDQCTFEGCLAPTGVCADTAADRREFSVTIDAESDGDDIEAAVGAQIIDAGIVNRWAFHNHWEIATLTQAGAERTQRLRDAVWSCRHTTPADDATTIMPFHMYNNRAGTWETTHLQVETDTYDEFCDWQSSVTAPTAISGLPHGRLHEATVRGVSAVKPGLPREFILEPSAAQTRFLKLALYNKDTILSYLDGLTL